MSKTNVNHQPLTETEFFNWLRAQQDNKRLMQSQVDAAHELLALMGTDELKSSLMQINSWHDGKLMQLSDSGMQMINEFEGFRSAPYRDAVGKPTIGFGSTYYPDRTPVTMNDNSITRERAAQIKQAVINTDFAPAVNLLFSDEIERGKLSQNMFDALISLVYNIGIKGLSGSSVTRHIKAGRYHAAADSFLLWNKGRIKGNLQVLSGLDRRRRAERALFLA